MRASTKRFLAKMAAVLLGLTAFLLLDAALTGTLSVIGAICLIPACLYIAAGFAEYALRPKRRRRRSAASRPQPVAQHATPQPALRVVTGGSNPNHAA